LPVPQFTTDETVTEEWRPIFGVIGFEVSSLGRFRTPTGRLLPVFGKRYRKVNLAKRIYAVHVLVARAFIGPRPIGLEINHQDLDKANNRASNLEYLTRSDNLKHRFSHPDYIHHWPSRQNSPRGEGCGMSKLTDNAIREIRTMFDDGIKARDIASKFNVHIAQVYRVRNKESWAHVI
jgi:hypothetical protein